MPTGALLRGMALRLVIRVLVLALVLGLGVSALGSAGPTIGVAQEEADDNEAPPANVEPTVSPLPTPVPSPSPDPIRARMARPLPSHDWRAAGYVSLVGGKLYDPYCRPLRSIGSNVPNMMFRDGLRENLEWMRQHQIRWL